MVWLKYYAKENEKYPDLEEKKLTNTEAEKVVRKAIKHFNITTMMVSGRKIEKDVLKIGNRYCTAYYKHFYNSGMIKLPSNPTVLTVLHELGHAIDHTNKMKKGIYRTKYMRFHGKEHAKCVKQLATWFKKNNKKWNYGV